MMSFFGVPKVSTTQEVNIHAVFDASKCCIHETVCNLNFCLLTVYSVLKFMGKIFGLKIVIWGIFLD